MYYKISIILPIYNMDKYLRMALDSIINQTFGFSNIEVIMVDDCSTDKSGEIIDEYSIKYTNFKAIHLTKNSGGPGEPKNIGLKNVSSDYVMFLDPDDELLPDICEVLYNRLIETNSDIVTGNAFRIEGENKFVDIKYADSFLEIYPNKDLSIFKPFRIWGSLFKVSFLYDNDINFLTNVKTNEDTYFEYKCFLNANKIYYLNDYCGMNYYVRPTSEHISLSHDFRKEPFIETIEAFKQILILISQSYPTKDFEYDPFILNIFARFENHWFMNRKDKIEVFNKILEYESTSNYDFKLPFHCRFFNFLLTHKLFNILIIVQSFFSSFVHLNFIQSILTKRRK